MQEIDTSWLTGSEAETDTIDTSWLKEGFPDFEFKEYTPDPYEPEPGSLAGVTPGSFINRLFDNTSLSKGGSIASQYLRGGVDLKNFSDEDAMLGAEYLEQKADELKRLERYTSGTAYKYGMGGMPRPDYGEPTYANGLMSEDTRKTLEHVFRDTARHFRADPVWLKHHLDYLQRNHELAVDGWEQYDNHKADPENYEYPPLHKAIKGEPVLNNSEFYEGLIRGVGNSFFLGMDDWYRETRPEADPILRGTEEAGYDTRVKQDRANYSAMVPYFRYMGGWVRIPGAGETPSSGLWGEGIGTLMTFLSVPIKGRPVMGPAGLAMEGGSKIMYGALNRLGVNTSKYYNTTAKGGTFFSKQASKAPVAKNIKGRAIQNTGMGVGYSLATQEPGLSPMERIDQSYLGNQVANTAKMLAVDVPIFVGFGEAIAQGAKLMGPLVRKRIGKIRTEDEFNQVLQDIGKRMDKGKQTDFDRVLLTMMIHEGQKAGIPISAMKTAGKEGKLGFAFDVFQRRGWTEIFPMIRKNIQEYGIQAKGPLKPRVEPVPKKPVDAEVTGTKPVPPKTPEPVVPQPTPLEPFYKRKENFVEPVVEGLAKGGSVEEVTKIIMTATDNKYDYQEVKEFVEWFAKNDERAKPKPAPEPEPKPAPEPEPTPPEPAPEPEPTPPEPAPEPPKPAEPKRIVHFTRKENVQKIVDKGYDASLPPIHGVRGGKDANDMSGKLGGDIMYFTTDNDRWSKAVVYVGEGKGTLTIPSYDYKTRKWVEEKNAYEEIDLSPVEAEIKTDAKVLTIDSYESASDFLIDEPIDEYFFIEQLLKEAKKQNYDVVNIVEGEGWIGPDNIMRKIEPDSSLYRELTGASGKDDYYVLNKEAIQILGKKSAPEPQKIEMWYDITKENISKATPEALYEYWKLAPDHPNKFDKGKAKNRGFDWIEGKSMTSSDLAKEIQKVFGTKQFLESIGWDVSPDAPYRDSHRGVELKFGQIDPTGDPVPVDTFPQELAVQFYWHKVGSPLNRGEPRNELGAFLEGFEPNIGANRKLIKNFNKIRDDVDKFMLDNPKARTMRKAFKSGMVNNQYVKAPVDGFSVIETKLYDDMHPSEFRNWVNEQLSIMTGQQMTDGTDEFGELMPGPDRTDQRNSYIARRLYRMIIDDKKLNDFDYLVNKGNEQASWIGDKITHSLAELGRLIQHYAPDGVYDSDVAELGYRLFKTDDKGKHSHGVKVIDDIVASIDAKFNPLGKRNRDGVPETIGGLIKALIKKSPNALVKRQYFNHICKLCNDARKLENPEPSFLGPKNDALVKEVEELVKEGLVPWANDATGLEDALASEGQNELWAQNLQTALDKYKNYINTKEELEKIKLEAERTERIVGTPHPGNAVKGFDEQIDNAINLALERQKTEPDYPFQELLEKDLSVLRRGFDVSPRGNAYDPAGGKNFKIGKKNNMEAQLNLLLRDLLEGGNLPFVEIHIPGDGTFKVINHPVALKEFKENAKLVRNVQPGNLQTILKRFTYPKDSHPRFSNKQFSWGKDAVFATDGKRVLVMKGKADGYDPLEMTMVSAIVNSTSTTLHKDPMNSAMDLHKGGDSPYIAKTDENSIDLKTMELWAKGVTASKYDENLERFSIHRGKDNKLAIRASGKNWSFNSANHDPSENDLFVVQPKYLLDAYRVAKKVNATDIIISTPEEETTRSPVFIFFEKKGSLEAYIVQMPVYSENTKNGYLKETYDSGYLQTGQSFAMKAFDHARRRLASGYRGEIIRDEMPGLTEFIKTYKRNENQNRPATPLEKFLFNIHARYYVNAYERGELTEQVKLRIMKTWDRYYNKLNQTYHHRGTSEFYEFLNSLAETQSRIDMVRKYYGGDVSVDINLLAGGFLKNVKDLRPSYLVGQTMPDIATEQGRQAFRVLAEGLRSNHYEFYHMIKVKDGKIIDTITTTIRHPSVTPIGPHPIHKENVKLMMQFAQGSDHVFGVHNHPGGDVTPSPADNNINDELTGKIAEYRGSLIINHGRYSFTETKQNAIPGDYEVSYGVVKDILVQRDLLKEPIIESDVIGRELVVKKGEVEQAIPTLEQHLHDIQAIDADGRASGYIGFHMNAQDQIIAVTRVQIDKFGINGSKNYSEILQDLRRQQQTYGSSRVTLYRPKPISEADKSNKLSLEAPTRELVEDNVVYQFLDSDPTELALRADDGSRLTENPDYLDAELVMDPGKEKSVEHTPMHEIEPKPSQVVDTMVEITMPDGTVVKQKINLDAMHPVKMPEGIALYKFLIGEVPKIKYMPMKRDGTRTLGYLRPDPNDPHIVLNTVLFKMGGDEAVKTFWHEIGHLMDFFDAMTMRRGNLLGRLISGLEFKGKSVPLFMGMADEIGPVITPKHRSKLRYEAKTQAQDEVIDEWERIIINLDDADKAKYAQRSGSLGRERKIEQYATYLAKTKEGPFANHFKALAEINKKITANARKKYISAMTKMVQESGVVGEAEVRAELLALMDWWKPIPETSPKKYIAYRHKAEELYADAISVLFNAPNELQERAPMFWQTFFNYLDQKPKLKKALDAVWEELRGGLKQTLHQRMHKAKQQYKDSEQKFIEKDREDRLAYNSFEGFFRQNQVRHYDYAYGIMQRAKQAKKPKKPGDKMLVRDEEKTIKSVSKSKITFTDNSFISKPEEYNWTNDPEAIWGKHPFSNNSVYLFLEKIHREIIQVLPSEGITIEDIGWYLFNTRVANEVHTNRKGEKSGRADLANPGGNQQTDAKQNLVAQSDYLGKKFAKVRLHAEKIRQKFYEIYRDMHDTGLLTDQQFSMIHNNRENYATFAVMDYLMDNKYVPAGLKEQYGTLKDIANPFTGMMLKAVTALKLIEWHNAKKSAIELLENHFPHEISELEHYITWNDKEQRREKKYNKKIEQQLSVDKYKDMSVMTLMRKGKQFKYVVPWDVAVAEFGVNPTEQGATNKVVNYIFRSLFYKTFVTYNMGFQLLWSPLKDFGRTAINMPQRASRMRILKEMALTLPDAYKRVQGELSPLLSEMMNVGAIGTPFDNYKERAFDGPDDIYSSLLERYHIRPTYEYSKYDILNKPIVRHAWRAWMMPWTFILRTGQMLEAMPKIGAYKVLTRDLGVPPLEAGEYVRNYVGVPAYWKRGSNAYILQAWLPFINVAMQGFMSDLRLATNRREGLLMNKSAKRLGIVGPLLGNKGKVKKKFDDPRFRESHGGRPKDKKTGKRERAEWTGAAYWFRMARGVSGGRLLMDLAKLGIFGKSLQEAYDYVSEYDYMNHTVIPLGYVSKNGEGEDQFHTLWEDNLPDDRKLVYPRLPIDETQKLIVGIQSLLTRSIGAKITDQPELAPLNFSSELTKFVNSQIPGLHPMIDMGVKGLWAGIGGNPYDGFTMNRILSNAEHKAQDSSTVKKMLIWGYNQTGANNFLQYNPDTDSTLEFNLQNIPGLHNTVGKLIRVSDRGLVEKGQKAEDAMEKRYARIRTRMGKETQKVYSRWVNLRGYSKENRPSVDRDNQWRLLNTWYNSIYSDTYDRMKHYADVIDNKFASKAEKSRAEQEIKRLLMALEESSKEWAK